MNNNERIGVSQVQLIVNQEMHWIFRELSIQDFGVDAHIEIMGQSYATGKLIGMQIKCGESYFKESNDTHVTFRFDEKHYMYWNNYSLPVIIVLVNPNSLEIIWEVIDTENTITASDHSYKILIKRENKFNKYATKKLLDISEGEKSSVSIGATCESYNYLNLGIKYEFGKEDHEVNYEKARYYYRLAADNGDKIAQFNLALLLIHGKGGSVDYSQAYVYMKKSALQDFVPAFYNLGLLFFHGKTLYKKDIDEAYFWLNKAKEKGHENAAIWLMYCELFRIIHSIKTPSVRTETIPFVDSFRNLISKVSVEDFISVIDCDIEQSNLVQWKKGLFYIASEATFNAHRHQDSEAADFWADFQKIILLFELLGHYFNYDFETFVINISYSQLEEAWKNQSEDGKEAEWTEPLYCIACNEIKNKSPFQMFWKHVIKCSNLLRRIEESSFSSTRIAADISVEIVKSSCNKIKVTLKNISFYINEKWDINIQGNVEAINDYKRLGKLIIKADLCDGTGRTLYTLKEYREIKLHLSGYDSFDMHCCSIERFLDLKRFCKIRIYPTIE